MKVPPKVRKLYGFEKRGFCPEKAIVRKFLACRSIINGGAKKNSLFLNLPQEGFSEELSPVFFHKSERLFFLAPFA
jgi:hypothetical protein